MKQFQRTRTHRLLLLLFIQASAVTTFALLQSTSLAGGQDNGINSASNENDGAQIVKPLHQLNCTANTSICYEVCNETQKLPYSSTFCDNASGSCICDCRNAPRKDCVETPFTPCFQDCVKKNPNPDVFLYKGGNCPMSKLNGTMFYQCACRCTFRDDYEETNDIIFD